MQRHRALAVMGAAGLGALAVVLLFTGDETPLPGVGLHAEAEAPAAPSESPGTLAHTAAPTLTPLTRDEQRLRRLRERLRPRPKAPHSTLAQLARAPGWIRFLEVWMHLPPTDDDGQRLARIQTALGKTTNPVIRQNLIFLAALALTANVADPWLQGLAENADDADAEDALCALAFSGDPAARAAFLRLATAPAPVTVRRIVDWHADHEAIGKRGTPEARDILRSYRAVEALARSPYFHMTAYLSSRFRSRAEGFGEMLGWTKRPAGSRDERIALLEAWLARYPGHPGSDDMALGIARIHLEGDDGVAATRWYSKATVLPDQDVAYGAATGLVAQCEVHLTPEQVLYLSEDEGLSTPNRRYYQYAWIRRLAAGRGFDVALHALEELATREPKSELGVAWARRFSTPPPKGIDSGLRPLAKSDLLKRVERARVAWPAEQHPHHTKWHRVGIVTSRWDDESRLHPWPEVVVLDRDKLSRQLRAWITLAELERRAERARGEARADLVYKQAAIYYHDWDVLFPAYGRHTGTFRGFLGGDERFEEETFAFVRALRLFAQIEREHRSYAALDKVIFSQAMLWRRLADYRPHWTWCPGQSWEDWGNRRRASMKNVAVTFERMVREFPDSPLAPDARAAAAWWRRARPAAFGAR